MEGLRWALVGVGAAALALVGAYWGLLFVAQRWVLFPAPRTPAESPAERAPDLESVWLDASGARSEAILLRARPGRATPGPLLVYAHGNGELIDQWVREFDAPRALGASVLLVEYPGYGRSAGKPSQASIARALVAAYDWAVARADVDPRRVVGYGRSLGGGAVCALARERSLAALVLESTFTSVRELAARFGLPGFLVRDPFDNLALVRGFQGPLLVLHGERDESIPVDHARRLHAAAPGSELHVLPCGHNDCPRPWRLLGSFLEKHRLL